MWHIWKGDFWREFYAWIGVMAFAWGILVSFIKWYYTHEWRWTGKTLLYALLGGVLIISGAETYLIYRNKLHSFFFLQNLNTQLTGTVESPIAVCTSDKVSLKVDTLMGDEINLTFPSRHSIFQHLPVRLRYGGKLVFKDQDGTTQEEQQEVYDMAQPLNLQPFFRPGPNRLTFYIIIEGTGTNTSSSTALVIRLFHNETERLLRLVYMADASSQGGWPYTDIFFDVNDCQAR